MILESDRHYLKEYDQRIYHSKVTWEYLHDTVPYSPSFLLLRLYKTNLAQIKEADAKFGELTVA
jgi:hypothetical protein